MISQFVGLSPALGSVLMAQSLEPASDSVSPSLSAPPPLMLCLSPSKINKNIFKKFKERKKEVGREEGEREGRRKEGKREEGTKGRREEGRKGGKKERKYPPQLSPQGNPGR